MPFTVCPRTNREVARAVGVKIADRKRTAKQIASANGARAQLTLIPELVVRRL